MRQVSRDVSLQHCPAFMLFHRLLPLLPSHSATLATHISLKAQRFCWSLDWHASCNYMYMNAVVHEHVMEVFISEERDSQTPDVA